MTDLSKEVAVKDFFFAESTNIQTGEGLSKEEKEQLKQSIEQCEEAVAIEEAKSDIMNNELPKLYCTLASLFEKSDDYFHTNDYYEKTLLLNEALSNEYSDNGDYLEAIIYYKNSLAIKEKALLADYLLLDIALIK